MKGILFFLALECTVSVGTATSQTIDSVAIVEAMRDTSALRSIILSHQGQRLAALALDRLGQIFFAAKNLDEAWQQFMDTYVDYSNEREEAMEAAYYLGIISLSEEQPLQAIKYLTVALQSDSLAPPSQDWARYYLVLAMFRSNDPMYLATVQSYLASKHDFSSINDASVRDDMVRYFANEGEYDSALNEADTLLILFPDDSLSIDVKFQVANLYLILGKYQDAITRCNQTIQGDAQNPSVDAHALCELGKVYESEGDVVNAKDTYRRVITSYPAQTRWVNAGEFGLAMIGYREAMSKPDSSYDEAYASLSEFVSGHPKEHDLPWALMALADLADARGNYNEELHDYNQVIGFDSLNIPKESESEVGSNDLKSFRELVVRARLDAANTLRLKLNSPEKALAIYDTLLTAYPENEEAAFDKALCLIKLGRIPEAKAVLGQLSGSSTEYGKLAQQTLESF